MNNTTTFNKKSMPKKNRDIKNNANPFYLSMFKRNINLFNIKDV